MIKKKFNYLNIIKNNFKNLKKKTFIISEQREYSFLQFYNYCKKYRDFLIHKSKKRFPVVCIYETKNLFDYIAMIGTLMAGGYYVPINKNTPVEKINSIIKSTNANFFSVNDQKSQILKKIKKNINLVCQNNIENLNIKIKKNYINSKIAYILFTSGTTGKPKGVIISKKNLNTYLEWLVNFFDVKTSDNISQFPSISFDLSVSDFYLAICKGCKLFIPSKIDLIFPSRMIKNNKITHLVCTPSFIDHIDNSKELNFINFKNVKTIFFCGEPLYEKQVKNIFKANNKIKIINAYGPTETTVSVTYNIIMKNNFKKLSMNTMSIGKAIKNSKIILVDKNLKKNNQEGEILISGKQLSEGYFKQKRQTNKKFIFLNKIRYFKTGDYAKKINGNLFFVKRLDNQIKFRGHRIELNEINHYLREFGFNNVYTFIHKDRIISLIQENKVDQIKIKNFLRKKIEGYKVPTVFYSLKKFPLNKSGKVDTKKIEKFCLYD